MKHALVVSALSAIHVLSFAQSANTITFRGEVAAQTCSMRVNGNASSAVVLLPAASMAQLSAPGSTAGATDFTISIAGCEAKSSPQAINTLFVPGAVTSIGSIRNSGTATNVNLQLLQSGSNSAFPLTSIGYAASGLLLAADSATASHNSRCAT